ncbi:ribosome biogenesis protein ytm1 [Coemansia sp. Benny D160-2]|nr:ribosome biogenesis protein ytm1 [Coemansia sp. Benny D160-2]
MDVLVSRILESDSHSSQSTDGLLESELTLDVAQKLSTELNTRLRQCKTELKQSLVDNHDTYTTAADEVERAQESITQLLHGVDELQAMFGDEETGIRARVIEAMEKEAHARKQIQDNGVVLEGLRVLESINAELRAMDALVRDARHREAARAIRAVEATVVGAHALDGTRIRAVLDDRIHLAAINVKDNVLRDLRRLVSFEVADSVATIRVAPLAREHAQPSNASSELAELYSALSTLDAGGDLAKAFSDRFVRDFVSPLLSVAVLADSTVQSTDDTRIFEVSLHREADGTTSASTVCNILSEALGFVNGSLLRNNSSEEAALLKASSILWADGCAPRLATLVVERCVLSCIPTTRKALAEFKDQIDVLVAFEDRLFGELCAEPTSENNGSSADRPIRSRVGQIEDLFARRRCDEALNSVRKLAESSSFSAAAMDGHERWTVDLVKQMVKSSGDSESDDTDADCQTASSFLVNGASKLVAGRGLLLFPKCTVSAAIRRLVMTAYGLVSEGAQSSLDTAPHVARMFVDTARCVFDVYRALFFALHRAQLTKIPALGWQFFNDCMYAAHHAGIIGNLVALLSESPETHQLPSSFAATTSSEWTATARLYVSIGKTHAASIVRQETEELRRLSTGGSKGADAFASASKDASKAQLAKIANQVRLSLTQLARAIRPPAVTPHVFYRTLGRYADAVFGATIDAIASIVDIGADDSQVLSDHCRLTLHSLAQLFLLDASVLEAYADIAPSMQQPSTLGGSSGLLGNADAAFEDLLNSGDDDIGDDNEGGAGGDGSPASGVSSPRRSLPSAMKLANEHCRLANKLAQLADILVISRADILARRRAGLLEDFTVDELVELVRALFTGTMERERDIMELESL